VPVILPLERDAPLFPRQLVRLAVRRAIASKNVGQLESGPRHRRYFRVLGLALRPRASSGLGGAGHHVRRDPGVAGSGVDARVAHKRLNDARVGSVFQQMRGEGVAQRVGRDAFGNAGIFRRIVSFEDFTSGGVAADVRSSKFTMGASTPRAKI
jgi:hypothetical protein